MLHSDFIKHLEKEISQIEGKTVKLRAYERIEGGDINQTYRLAMTDKDYFIKVNDSSYADMFEKEAKGLALLQQSQAFKIPKVFKRAVFNNYAYLLMAYIEPLIETENPDNFARNLAKLHNNTAQNFGLEFDNYIGTLPQKNHFETNWVDFYRIQRLQFQLQLSGNSIPVYVHKAFESLFHKLPELLPEEKPALLHGDLWHGNYFYNLKGQAVLVDPAVYYGHREMDLAMMSLFGGFSPQIYERYQEVFPLQKDWKKRLKIYQLYPLLVHVNLFGVSYLESIKHILKYYVKMS